MVVKNLNVIIEEQRLIKEPQVYRLEIILVNKEFVYNNVNV